MIDEHKVADKSQLLTEEMEHTLKDTFQKLERNVVLKAVVDLAEEKNMELAVLLKHIVSLSEKLSLELYEKEEAPEELDVRWLPVTGLYLEEKYTGLAYHGVPGGKEMNSFIIGIYNVGGKGQKIGFFTDKKISKIRDKVNLKVCVSLSCGHCPKMVMNCQRIASLNENIQAEMIDAALYPDLIEKYKIERVPMTIVNDDKVIMGVKEIEELLGVL